MSEPRTLEDIRADASVNFANLEPASMFEYAKARTADVHTLMRALGEAAEESIYAGETSKPQIINRLIAQAEGAEDDEGGGS
jgi:hypothetical protein